MVAVMTREKHIHFEPERTAFRLLELLIGTLLFAVVPLSGQVGLDAQLLAKAKAGDPKAEALVGRSYDLGIGVPQDHAEAVRWWRMAADQGIAYAQASLGAAYDLGQGVPKDYEKAFAWFRKSAEQGYAFAENDLGVYYEAGRGVQQDYAQAVIWYQKAADQDYAPAENNLGLAYYRGHGVPKDYEQTVMWFRKAAQQGYIEAERNLAALYDRGEGVIQDDAQAAFWYRKAADQGDAGAQNQLGALYYHGSGVPQDYTQAAVWIRKGAEQGNATAQCNLGDMYHLGQGVKQSNAEAIAWYEKAADQGVAFAKEILPQLSAEKSFATPTVTPESATSQTRIALSPQAIAERASESTVLVVSTDRTGKRGYLGSGFAIEPNLLLTNSHVFQDGRLGFVRKIGSDHLLHIEQVILRDRENDIVLLYVPDLNLPSLPIQPSEPVIGDTVFAMGNPEGMEGTFSEGLVSALRNTKGIHLIQITAPISHGSSGGPVFNIYGEVIGISTSTLTSGQNLNFAVPASAIDALLEKARSK